MLLTVKGRPIVLDETRIAFRECIVSNFLDPPYIVSGANSKTVTVYKKGKIRSVIRPMTEGLNSIYSDVILKIEEIGNQLCWENVFPASIDGLKSAIEYVKSFSDQEMNVQVVNWGGDEDVPGVEFIKEEWVPDGYCVVITKDRSYLGDIHLYGDDNSSYSVFVHNPGRAISIIKK